MYSNYGYIVLCRIIRVSNLSTKIINNKNKIIRAL